MTCCRDRKVSSHSIGNWQFTLVTTRMKVKIFIITEEHWLLWLTINHSVSQSVSQWNAWPATGRSALQDLRSRAILQASLAFSPVSSSICCTHVRQGRPRWRFHSGLMSGLPPVRASTARCSAEWAGVASGSRRHKETINDKSDDDKSDLPSGQKCVY